eukprot:scaffold10269_cov102-Isochrysis_galbana.AAC.14
MGSPPAQASGKGRATRLSTGRAARPPVQHLLRREGRQRPVGLKLERSAEFRAHGRLDAVSSREGAEPVLQASGARQRRRFATHRGHRDLDGSRLRRPPGAPRARGPTRKKEFEKKT